MAMHVPDFDFTKATKPRATCPWGDDLGVLNDFQTTYNQHFRHYPSARLAPIKPSPAMSWADGAVGYNIKSTTQDSFQPPSIAFKQLPSCKPKLVFTSVPHQAPISSTSQTAFVRFGSMPRTLPCLPKPNRRVETGEKFTGRATTQEAFQPHPEGYRPREPFLPKQGDPAIGSATPQMATVSTTAASYPKHNVQPYIPAKKPQPNYGLFSD